MKLLDHLQIKRGLSNGRNYPDEEIRENVRDIEVVLTDLDINIETDRSIALDWDTLEMFTEDQLFQKIKKISDCLVSLDKKISSHVDDYHFWRFNLFMVTLNHYLQLGLTISDRPTEIDRVRTNSAYDMGKFLFNNR